jgi:hypothetical protein
MNKRIEKLATEVGISIEYLTNTKQLVLIEKFAELIVNECCNVLHDNEMGGYQVNYVLKEHFGVE